MMIDSIMGKKLGMTRVFREGGNMEAVTAVEAGPCTVLQVKTQAKDGYAAAQLGFGQAKKITSPRRGQAKGLMEPTHIKEVAVGDDDSIEVGQELDAGLFQAGDRVDVIGVSKGKGFAGTVKRYHFRGGPKTHGQSDRHRAPGSVGAGTTPGRVIKGMRMAGHMGHERVTALNLEVVESDPERNLLLLRGAVPGASGGLVMIRKTNRGKK